MASEMNNEPHTIQFIGGDGSFNYHFNGFMNGLMKTVNFDPYQVVSIIGPQSSGKRTLLNHLFKTRFEEMDALNRRGQTTKGIWLATCAYNPATLVVDVEGTDGKERGMDDVAFEKQSALFALAISNIVIINMWVHDVGREHAGSRPLLRTVFQVMMQLFKPSKTMLLFVMRDKTKTPPEKLEQKLQADIQEMWDSVIKPQEHKSTQFDDFFNMEFMTLSSYEYNEKEFVEQVEQLKGRLPSLFAPKGLACNRPIDVPVKGFAQAAKEIWKNIKAKKELNLPKHAEMVAITCCDEIANNILSRLFVDKDWSKLKIDAHLLSIAEFGEKCKGNLGPYLSEYDKEANYFDKRVTSAKRQQLESSTKADIQPAYEQMMATQMAAEKKKAEDAEWEARFWKGVIFTVVGLVTGGGAGAGGGGS